VDAAGGSKAEAVGRRPGHGGRAPSSWRGGNELTRPVPADAGGCALNYLVRVAQRYRRRTRELRRQLHRVLGGSVAALGIAADRADHLSSDHQRHQQRRVHTQPCHPTAEARPTTIASKRSADDRAPRLYTRDARPSLSSWCWTVSISRTKSTFTAHTWIWGTAAEDSDMATPAPSTPGMARCANCATSWSSRRRRGRPATMHATVPVAVASGDQTTRRNRLW
jgi:hypothetical protein